MKSKKTKVVLILAGFSNINIDYKKDAVLLQSSSNLVVEKLITN